MPQQELCHRGGVGGALSPGASRDITHGGGALNASDRILLEFWATVLVIVAAQKKHIFSPGAFTFISRSRLSIAHITTPLLDLTSQTSANVGVNCSWRGKVELPTVHR